MTETGTKKGRVSNDLFKMAETETKKGSISNDLRIMTETDTKNGSISKDLKKMAETDAEKGSVFNSVFWFFVMVIISFWLASLCVVPYFIVSILMPCFPGLKGASDILLAGIMFPLKCSDNMINRRPFDTL